MAALSIPMDKKDEAITQVENMVMRGALAALITELRLCREVIATIDETPNIDLQKFKVARIALSDFDRNHKR